MAYKHGVYTSEAATSIVAPITGTAGLIVAVGTAPVNMVADPKANTPIIAYSYKEAVEAVGFSNDFEKYTLCDAISACFQVAGTGPIILINVLDPANTKFTADITTTTAVVTDGIANVGESGILVDKLVVKKDASTTLVKGTDYSTVWNDDGTLSIILSENEKTKGLKSLTLSGKKLDPSIVKAADIVGGVDSNTGTETGIEVVRQVFPKLNMVPGIIIAPRFSADPMVSAALQAKTNMLNGSFGSTCIIDVDSSSTGAKKYADVKAKKETQGLTSQNAYAVWLYGKIGETIYSGSSLAAALTAYTDAVNNDTPNVSPSNKTISITSACLADGTDVLLDREQANVVNSFGVATWLNMNGFRLWGNNTAAYPGATDPKNRWLSVRRFMTWAANTFILTYSQKVDDPGNPRLIEAIVDSENIRGNGFVSRGICARYEITYDAEENASAEDGHVIFHQYMTPYGPAEVIQDVIEYDPEALKNALSA